MSRKIIQKARQNFEDLKKINPEGVEYWEARGIMPLLDYTEWRNFEKVIEKAKKACEKSGQSIDYHFVDVNKMIKVAMDTDKEAEREIHDYHLSRYACYLIAQNGDSRKKEIALAQTYFAVQTRKQELLENLSEDDKRLLHRGEIKIHNRHLFSTARTVGVKNFGSFNNAGYKGLYGGLTVQQIKKKKQIGKDDILDRAGATELAANLFRITQTDDQLRRDEQAGHVGEAKATATHFTVGMKVRQAIRNIGGTMPEQLPSERHIKELKKDDKKVLVGTVKL